MYVGILGINQKLAHVQLRERLAQACQRRFNAAVHGYAFVLLSTCNRTEIYFSGPNLTEVHSAILAVLRREVGGAFEHLLYSYFGADCFLHLARVTAGLDSAVVGETEIQGQVKLAYEAARIQTALPANLHFLFQKALGIGKRVRSVSSLERSSVGVESEVVRLAHALVGSWEGKRLLFVGASAVNLRVLKRFVRCGARGITVCNRTDRRAEQAAQACGALALPWAHLGSWTGYDVVVFGTKAPQPLIWAHQWRPQGHRPVLIDLSVPRNVDPVLSHFCSVTNIDEVNARVALRRQVVHSEVEAAAQMVAESVERHLERRRTALRYIA